MRTAISITITGMAMWFAGCFQAVKAQESTIDNYVQPLDNYISDYRDKHNLINDYLERNTTLTLSQKLQEYDAQMDLLKDNFKQKRKTEYEAIVKTTSVSHSCTKGNSGGTKFVEQNVQPSLLMTSIHNLNGLQISDKEVFL